MNRRYKLAFRNHISFEQPILTTTTPPSNPSFFSCLISPPTKKPNLETPSKRFYYVDRNQVHHFKPRGPRSWLRHKTNILIGLGLGTGVASTLYFTNVETIPYTKRNHFVLLSPRMERQMGELEFQNLKKSFKDRILPGLHPESVRVKLIAKHIIEALQRGMNQETEGSGVKDAVGKEREERRGGGEDLDGAVLDDRWVRKCRKRAQERGLRAATKHLNGLHWEVLLVDEPVVNAFCLPGGKIVVFTGLLKHFTRDSEVATIIGHEVAHAVARHSAEGMTKNMWVAIVQIILLQFVSMPEVISAMSSLLLKLPFSRRMEIEADYIGLLLIASAGYDPRIAPRVYEKLGELGGESPLRDYLSTHPSGKKRARLLAQAQVMEEALAIYTQVRAGHLVQDFL